MFLTQANLGDAFIVRNIANIIPPFGHDSVHEHQGTIAALEYAVLNLKIENIIVLGHSSCGGIKALMDNSPDTAETLPNIHRWLKNIRASPFINLCSPWLPCRSRRKI